MKKNFLNRTIIWILLLTFTAGYANILSIYTIGLPVTHATGSLTNISYAIFEMNFEKAIMLITFITLFLVGGIISGFVFSEKEFGKGKSYGIILLVMGMAIAIIEYFIGNRYVMVSLIAITSGVQNGLNITYNEVTIRTTHMTGYVSDIGRLIGLKLHGRKIENDKLLYLIFAVLMYFLGGVVAIVISLPEHGHNFYEISILYIVAGLLYLKSIYNKVGYEKIKKYSK